VNPCGNGACDVGETEATCPADCQAGPACYDDFSTGTTFFVGNDTTAFHACDAIPPTNCSKGHWLEFGTGECVCLVRCDEIAGTPALGESCGLDNVTCLQIQDKNGQGGPYCVADQWKLCTKPGTPVSP